MMNVELLSRKVIIKPLLLLLLLLLLSLLLLLLLLLFSFLHANRRFRWQVSFFNQPWLVPRSSFCLAGPTFCLRSFSTILLHVVFGPPSLFYFILFHFFFQPATPSPPCMQSLFLSILSTCPVHFHLRLRISSLILFTTGN